MNHISLLGIFLRPLVQAGYSFDFARTPAWKVRSTGRQGLLPKACGEAAIEAQERRCYYIYLNKKQPCKVHSF
jgi:hypothetical protein